MNIYKKLCLAIVVVLVLGAVFIGVIPEKTNIRSLSSGAVSAHIPVTIVQAQRRDAIHESDVVGSVESLQYVTIRPQIDGILTKIYFTEGQLVEEGELLASIDDRALQAALSAAQAQLARDQALLKAAELDLQRYETLVPQGAVSLQENEQRIARANELRASIRLHEAHIETAKVNLSYAKIHAPVSGRIGMRLVDEGNLVREGDAQGIVTLAQIDPISIVFPVSQNLLKDLQQAIKSDPSGNIVQALDPVTRDVLATGKITALDNIIDVATGTMRVRALFDNQDEILAPGAFVAVRIRTGITRNAIVLPAVAVRPGVSGSFVYRVRDNVAERVPVVTGYSHDDFVVITEGVAVGDHIVRSGHSRLTDGVKISVQAGDAPDDTGDHEPIPRPQPELLNQ